MPVFCFDMLIMVSDRKYSTKTQLPPFHNGAAEDSSIREEIGPIDRKGM